MTENSAKITGWIRQSHRWVSLAFTLTVIANFAAFGLGQPVTWLTYLPLPPLFFLMFSGLYMFFRPYFIRKSVSTRTPSQS